MDILKIENVSKSYIGHVALDNVSLNVPEGSVYGLLGPNGAGKTTLIRIVNHITAPDSGVVYFNGHQLNANDVYDIGYLPEERGLYKKMKVGEQAVFFARLKGLSHYEATVRLKEWFDRFGILDWWNRKVEELSKGMAQKVQFIITVLHKPRLLIFDEPFSGFDPINAKLLKDEILRLRDMGSTIIFSTHNMSSVEEICDHITLINKSKNILSGSVDEIRNNYVRNRYVLTFDGNGNQLLDDLSPLLIGQRTLTDMDNGRVSAMINIAPNSSLRDVISIANERVVLRSINEAIPSMNDIFIEAVQSSNS
ncbi:MAG: ATP-binding cassette domain-containing protein [Muribaculaceae bacterium]|jgi:ABC-2 type transport system ATP-binding protein|nr:ATP-binding cassette domain-containing protein [Muribaculaceae bacterium]